MTAAPMTQIFIDFITASFRVHVSPHRVVLFIAGDP
jgi:hypothetical protein